MIPSLYIDRNDSSVVGMGGGALQEVLCQPRLNQDLSI